MPIIDLNKKKPQSKVIQNIKCFNRMFEAALLKKVGLIHNELELVFLTSKKLLNFFYHLVGKMVSKAIYKGRQYKQYDEMPLGIIH